jgi:hypothetical protein
MQSATLDFSHIPDECIKRDEKGRLFKVKWVNKLDAWGEPSETEIGYYQRFGFEFVYGKKKDKDGKHTPKDRSEDNRFERREFIAMQGPVGGFAAFLAKNAKPGSDVYERANAPFSELVDETNKRAGFRYVEEITSDHHGPEPPHRVTFGE